MRVALGTVAHAHRLMREQVCRPPWTADRLRADSPLAAAARAAGLRAILVNAARGRAGGQDWRREYPAVDMRGCCDGGSVLAVVALLLAGHPLTLQAHVLLVRLDCSVDA